jgi:hypothetical protein
MFAVNIYESAQKTAELINELNTYVNFDRKQVVREAFEKLALRLVVIIAWVPYLLLFFHHLVPYVIVVAQAASLSLLSLAGAGYLILGITLMFLALHIHTVLLRLLALRARLFN